MKKDDFINKWSISSNERERKIRDEFISDLESLLKNNTVKNTDYMYCKRSDCNRLRHKDNAYCLEHLYEHTMSGY